MKARINKGIVLAIVTAVTAVTFAGPERQGGIIVKPGSQKGKVAFIDTQSRLNESNIKGIVATLAEETGFNIVYEKAAPADCPYSLKNASKADLAIVIIDDAKKPSSVVAPDDHWAMVNIAKLDVKLRSEAAKKKFFEGRCRRQILRIYALAAGGGASSFQGNLTHPCQLDKLDLYAEMIPEDVKERNVNFLSFIGMTKQVTATYRKACMEGWAPAPTNDVQKAIWNKAHELPTEPVKIEFDPKRDKVK